MREREGFPAGVPAWVDTAQPDPDAAAAFYSDLFGWTFADRGSSGPEGSYLVASLSGRAVAAVTAQPAGVTVAVEPFDIPPVRSAVLVDPGGARFTVSAFKPEG